MYQTFLKSVLEPLFLRIGSIAAGGLIGLGMASQHGPSIQAAVTAVGLLVVELLARKLVRK